MYRTRQVKKADGGVNARVSTRRREKEECGEKAHREEIEVDGRRRRRRVGRRGREEGKSAAAEEGRFM